MTQTMAVDNARPPRPEDVFGVVVTVYGGGGSVKAFRNFAKPERLFIREEDYGVLYSAAEKCWKEHAAGEPVRVTSFTDTASERSWVFYETASQIEDQGADTFSRVAGGALLADGHAPNTAEAGLFRAIREAEAHASKYLHRAAASETRPASFSGSGVTVLEHGRVEDSETMSSLLEACPLPGGDVPCVFGVEVFVTDSEAINGQFWVYDDEWIPRGLFAKYARDRAREIAYTHIASGNATVAVAVDATGSRYAVVAADWKREGGIVATIWDAVDVLLDGEEPDERTEQKLLDAYRYEDGLRKMVLRRGE
jgi:hypothetical protein